MSAWIKYIERSDEEWDADNKTYVIATVYYENQQGFTNGDLYFWVTLDDYEELVQGEGSVYWHKWKLGGKEHYSGQDDFLEQMWEDALSEDDDEGGGGDSGAGVLNNISNKIEEIEDDLESASENFANKNKLPSERTSKNIHFDNESLVNRRKEGARRKVIKSFKNSVDKGNEEEALRNLYEKGYKEEQIEAIKTLSEKVDAIDNLYQKTSEIRALLSAEELTTKKAVFLLMRDIEDLFGVSIDGRIKGEILSQISAGKFNPSMFVRYKAKIKSMYDLLEKEGIEGAAKIGKRFINSKNPLIRNRVAYKGKEVLRTIRQTEVGRKYYEGEAAVREVLKYHRKLLKEESKGVIKRNSYKLERRYVKRGGKKILQVFWKRDVSLGRRLVVLTKRTIKIAKWVALF